MCSVVIYGVVCASCFLKINSDHGTKKADVKVGKNGKTVATKKDLMNPPVSTLMNKIADFEWCD